MELLNKLPIEGKKVVANAMLVSEGRPYMKYVEGVKTGMAVSFKKRSFEEGD